MSDAPPVLKFGGSTFTSPQSYSELAERLARRIETEGRSLVVVVSAMPGETERLRERLHEVDPHPEDARTAGLLTLADTVSAQLLAVAMHRTGRTATVLAGHQLGLTTDDTFMWAKVARMDPGPLVAATAAHDVVVVPGGQAVDDHRRPTWLGKNSSDLTAVLIAAALGGDTCEVYSDVDGIYSADPRVVAGTRLLKEVSYDTASLMSLHGAKVLHRRAVHTAKQAGVSLVCRLNKAPYPRGTVIGPEGGPASGVILNQRSQVLAYRDEEEADHAHSVFHAQGVDTVRVEGGPHLALIGGFLDLEGFSSRHGLPPATPIGIPVAELDGSRLTTHVAPDASTARDLAQKLHDALPTAEHRLRSVV